MGRLMYFSDGIINEEEFTEDDRDYFLEKSEELVEQDYTVLINSNSDLFVDLSKSFSESDYKNLMKVISTYTPEELTNMKISNHIIRNGLEDQDTYDYSYIQYVMNLRKEECSDEEYNQALENRKPIKVLDIYARQRIGKLTPKEEEMYEKYITFDLDFLLFSEDVYKETLNTDNCGFISIFEDCTYKNTNTMDNHEDTEKKQEEWYRKMNKKEPGRKISIHIVKNAAAIFIPDNINEYQKEELSNIILEIEELCKFHNQDIDIEAGIEVRNGQIIESFTGLSQIKERFVQNESKGK